MCTRLTHYEMCLVESSHGITGISHTFLIGSLVGKSTQMVFEVEGLRQPKRQSRVLYTLDWPLQALTCTSTACIHRVVPWQIVGFL
jgi:hypothetical protein